MSPVPLGRPKSTMKGNSEEELNLRRDLDLPELLFAPIIDDMPMKNDR
jgi:hypothetical protein